MKSVNVNKNALLEKLRKNRDAHRGLFERALEGWHAEVIAALTIAMHEAREGKRYRTYFQLPEPEDHTEDYDNVIGMLEMDLDNSVELTISEYRNYVEDDWGWKGQFTASTAQYLDS